MAYAIDYMQEKGLSETVLKQINFVRIKKEVYLPCELIGMNRRMFIGTYETTETKSQIRWRFYNYVSEKINKGQKTILNNSI